MLRMAYPLVILWLFSVLKHNTYCTLLYYESINVHSQFLHYLVFDS